MKIKSYFLSALAIIGFIAVTSINSFAQQQPQKQQKEQKHQKQKDETPSWMTSQEYDTNTKNVYFPKQDMYYNVKNKTYIYKNEGKWEKSKSVPTKYKNVDFNNAQKVKLTKKTSKPQKHNTEHKKENSSSKNNKQNTPTKEQQRSPNR